MLWPCDVKLESVSAVNPWGEDKLKNKCFVRLGEFSEMPLSLFSLLSFSCQEGPSWWTTSCNTFPLTPSLHWTFFLQSDTSLQRILVSLFGFCPLSCWVSASACTKKTRRAFTNLWERALWSNVAARTNIRSEPGRLQSQVYHISVSTPQAASEDRGALYCFLYRPEMLVYVQTGLRALSGYETVCPL